VASGRKRRIAENESLFREANERMKEWEERDRAEALELYFCECEDLECREKVRVRGSDYERVRGDSLQFLVAPGHQLPEVETVIESHDEWVLVKKEPEVREIVEEGDPRQG
jgi:hypothetical protein